ncbi:MAG: DNA-binding response regulator [Betaproteobacteria bacterium]|nr:DNA-binding response regulator [Betaproteobacteria bacterium]
MAATTVYESPVYPLVRSSPKVLCIDAEDESRLLVAEILYEHEVDFALTADDAVQLAHCRAYDLYFLDPAVPGFSEIDVIRELRRFDPHVPLVICTASDPVLCRGQSIQARLQKPLSARCIRETVTRLARLE